MRTQKPALLLLDAGNTLVFLDHGALSEAARHAGLTVEASALARAEPLAKRRYENAMKEGVSHEEGWTLHMRAIFELAGLSVADAQVASEAARRAHEAFNLWRRVPEGLSDALDRAAHAGIRLGVVSNSEGQLDALFDRLGLSRHFEHVVDSALEGVRKPEPEIFRRALARFAESPERALYAGDIPKVDVDGARGAGMEAVLIDPFDHYPGYVDAPRFNSVAELIQTFDA